MRRILLLVTVASMLAAAMALSGVAQAAPISDKADAQCAKLAIKTLGPGFNPSNYTFIGGTEGSDNFSNPTQATAGPDVFCGFGDSGGFADRDVISELHGGDIFLGGAGIDDVDVNQGTFYGEAGDDVINQNLVGGTFFGGEGNDSVSLAAPGSIFFQD